MYVLGVLEQSQSGRLNVHLAANKGECRSNQFGQLNQICYQTRRNFSILLKINSLFEFLQRHFVTRHFVSTYSPMSKTRAAQIFLFFSVQTFLGQAPLDKRYIFNGQ